MAVQVKRFEDLIAWQKARALAREIYQLSSVGDFARDFGLRDQIRRAAVSVMSNVAEGFERGSRAEFHHFLVVAKASCAEVRSQLYIAHDIGYISAESFILMLEKSEELSKIIGGLRASVQRQRDAK